MPLQALVAEALQLPPDDLDALIVSLLAHRDADPEVTPEEIEMAWAEEAERRVDAME